jgi:hypothetical protein
LNLFFLFRFLLERWNEVFFSFLWNHRRLSGVETHSGIHLTRWILSMLLLLYLEGVHVGGRGGKRQYYCADCTDLREEVTYGSESKEAANNSSNVFGHLGRSILHDNLDVPLPSSIIVDYLYVTLLRHTRAIIHQTYMKLCPAQRIQLDASLRSQNFPHFFNRKVRAISDFSFVKWVNGKSSIICLKRLRQLNQ